MSGSGRGGNNRRGFRRKEKDRDQWGKDSKKKGNNPLFDKNRGSLVNRPKWTAPSISAEPIPVPDCAYCGKPIRDLSSALTDKTSGTAVHFDCVIARLMGNETLERGDTLAYIGGGRFGIIHYPNPQDVRSFTIKKIFEWEERENRAEWRKTLADHYSVT
jgi:hypothetical protein